ncbi:MAG: methyl-accepting chemotaxis protein [Deltaproteobacteria bacterium]|nr:methyl-accepting chemotaxis protein [Deltaproteobacteria bacterium]MDQ3295295.1 methyl-accepting chemotaxis protein [Myxococcota bacterium]
MISRKRRFPMFLKFLFACLSLAALLIVGGIFMVKEKSQFQNRGKFMVKHLRRYQFYQERVGRGLTGNAEILAGETAIRNALAATPAAGPEPTPELSVAGVATSMYDRIATKHGIQPDLFAVFSDSGRVLWASKGSPISAGQISTIAAVKDARAGNVFPHRIQVIDNTAYQISAMPVRAPGAERVVGGIVVGVKLQRMMLEYAEQSDEVAELRYRPTLVDGPRVLATALPGELADVTRAVQPDKLAKVTVGEDTREVIRLKDNDYDFYAEDQDGYKEGDPVTVGKLYITRSRARVIDPAKSLPWGEIAVGVGASLVFSFLLGIWVTRPIKQMVKQSRDLLTGDTDLTQRIVVNSRDETADLADNINQVFARVHHLASGVQSAAFQVGASSAEISAASRQMLTGLRDQTLKIESSTTAVTELSASIQQVAGNAAQATDVAEQSSTAVTSAVARMEQIRTAVDDAAAKMRDLGESSKRIGNIVEVIRQISEQTSMLALNASIEAAHAGEQGRGFAVVADEVSSLARRVGQSAKDIEALIQTVKEQTQAAIQSMDVGTREVLNGSQLVTGTLTGLGQLISVVKETATAVHEQAVVSDEIARNMDAVRHLAGDALNGSEESVVQAERLHELAYELEESIGGFNLDGTKVGNRPRVAASIGTGAAGDASRALPAGKPKLAGNGRAKGKPHEASD